MLISLSFSLLTYKNIFSFMLSSVSRAKELKDNNFRLLHLIILFCKHIFMSPKITKC